MDLLDIAANYHREKEVASQKIRHEKRYVVIIEVVYDNGRAVYDSGAPILDIQRAKKLAMEKVDIEREASLTFRCIESQWADVPIESVLNEAGYEMQAISSRFLTPIELKDVLDVTNYNGTTRTNTES